MGAWGEVGVSAFPLGTGTLTREGKDREKRKHSHEGDYLFLWQKQDLFNDEKV